MVLPAPVEEDHRHLGVSGHEAIRAREHAQAHERSLRAVSRPDQLDEGAHILAEIVQTQLHAERYPATTKRRGVQQLSRGLAGSLILAFELPGVARVPRADGRRG